MKLMFLMLYYSCTYTVKSESCSFGDDISCAGLVALCSAACIDPLDGICEACFGGAYAKCVGCISLTSKVNIMKTASGKKLSLGDT